MGYGLSRNIFLEKMMQEQRTENKGNQVIKEWKAEGARSLKALRPEGWRTGSDLKSHNNFILFSG